jgi:hypothetical protein
MCQKTNSRANAGWSALFLRFWLAKSRWSSAQLLLFYEGVLMLADTANPVSSICVAILQCKLMTLARF